MPALLVGLSGAAASALLYAAFAGGGALGAPLFLLSPLPIAIVGLGWGTLPAIVAALAAALGLGLGLATKVGLVHLVLISAPMVLYAHLMGLARPGSAADTVEWYPVQRVLVAMTLATAAASVIAGVIAGFDPEAMGGDLAAVLQAYYQANPGADIPDHDTLVAEATLLMRLMPFFFSASWIMVAGTNLAIAIRIVRQSGRFRRPKERFSETLDLPAIMAGLFLAAWLLSFTSGPVGQIAATLAGSATVAYAVTGFAVLHVLLRDRPAGPFFIGLTYALTLFLTLPALLLVIVGLLDRPLALRRRRLARLASSSNQGPPR